MRALIRSCFALALLAPLCGCVVTTIVGAAVDVAKTAVEIPIKVGGAVVDAATSEDKDKAKKDENKKKAEPPAQPASTTASADKTS